MRALFSSQSYAVSLATQAAALCLPGHSFTAEFSSVQDGIYVLRKAHKCSTPSPRSFPSITFQMVPTFV